MGSVLREWGDKLGAIVEVGGMMGWAGHGDRKGPGPDRGRVSGGRGREQVLPLSWWGSVPSGTGPGTPPSPGLQEGLGPPGLGKRRQGHLGPSPAPHTGPRGRLNVTQEVLSW